MPRYYCDYCDMYLTHDSAGGRKEHVRGWKHRDNVIAHFKPMLQHFMKSGEGNTWTGWQNSMKGGQGPPPLPPGWEQHMTGLSQHEKRRPYYIHVATGICTWVHPLLLKPEELPENGGEPKKPWEDPTTSKIVAKPPQPQVATDPTVPLHAAAAAAHHQAMPGMHQRMNTHARFVPPHMPPHMHQQVPPRIMNPPPASSFQRLQRPPPHEASHMQQQMPHRSMSQHLHGLPPLPPQQQQQPLMPLPNFMPPPLHGPPPQ